MPRYEYRCRRCGFALESASRQLHGDPCHDCTGQLARVWSANVTTATVPGFYANSRRTASANSPAG